MVDFCGLYAIADTGLIPDSELAGRVSQAIAGGARMVQYRDKGTDAVLRKQQAAALKKICDARGIPLIVNDDVELAAAVAAAGVHLGRSDAALEDARSMLGGRAIIGISCYDDWQRAQDAAGAGADYVAFGRFYPSRTKPDAVTAQTRLLRDARHSLDLPVVAIGGITPDNGYALIEAGAAMLAVIHGIFGVADTQSAALSYARLFSCGE